MNRSKLFSETKVYCSTSRAAGKGPWGGPGGRPEAAKNATSCTCTQTSGVACTTVWPGKYHSMVNIHPPPSNANICRCLRREMLVLCHLLWAQGNQRSDGQQMQGKKDYTARRDSTEAHGQPHISFGLRPARNLDLELAQQSENPTISPSNLHLMQCMHSM